MCKVSPSSPDSTVPPNKKQIVCCRLCGQPIAVTPWVFNGKDMSIITCDNPNCAVYDYTFTVRDYQTRDLTPYQK